MSVVGLITEYNPFHNGHLYHLEHSKAITGSDYSVCVMSGNFIQRGEPALVDKWTRAKMAVRGGVDLVIELPVVYALQTAELFAFGAVKILDSLGIVDNICFGSEAGTLDLLDKISRVLVEEPQEFKCSLKKHLDTGILYPVARARALEEIIEDDNLKNLLESSNNILSIEYLKALKRIDSKIVPYTLQRVKNEYNSTSLQDTISSATAIRQALLGSGNVETVRKFVPATTFETLSEEISESKGPVFSHHFDNLVLSEIRKSSLDQIRDTFDVEEGLEYRIKEASMSSSDIQELIKAIKTKRYTQTRIQRILFRILLGIKRDIYQELSQAGGPQYIRVLGFNQKGQKLLNTAKKKAVLPIITKVADFKYSDNALLRKMLDHEINATNLYTLAYKNPKYRVGDLDYTHKIIIEK